LAYTVRPLDAETGLYDYRARWYDAEVGRFVSEDPLGFAAGDMNTYRYVGNSPLDYTDPSGMSSFSGVGSLAPSMDSLSDQGLRYTSDSTWTRGYSTSPITSSIPATTTSLAPSPFDSAGVTSLQIMPPAFSDPYGPYYNSYTQVTAWPEYSETRHDSYGREYYAGLDAQGQTIGLYDTLGNPGCLETNKYGYVSFRESGVEYITPEEPSSAQIWLGLGALYGLGPAVGALAGSSTAAATTLKVGGAATVVSSAYMAEEYSRASYYSAQAGDTVGVVENAMNAGLNVATAGLGAYTYAKAAQTPTRAAPRAPSQFQGTAKPWTKGATPRSTYTHIDPKTGRAV